MLASTPQDTYVDMNDAETAWTQCCEDLPSGEVTCHRRDNNDHSKCYPTLQTPQAGQTSTTWQFANNFCLSRGWRLCTTIGERNECCGKGCGYDSKITWTGVAEGKKFL